MGIVNVVVALVACLVAFWVGKKFFDWKTPGDLNSELTQNDNPAVGALFACYVVALTVALVGTLQGLGGSDALGIVKAIAMQMTISLILLQLTIAVIDWVIFPKIKVYDWIFGPRKHIGLAIVCGAACINAGFIILGANTGHSPNMLWGLFDLFAVWVLGMAFIFVAHVIYKSVTPYDYLSMITMGTPSTDWSTVESRAGEANKAGTMACAWSTAGYWLGIGFLAQTALSGISFSTLVENPAPLYTAFGKLAFGLILMVGIARLFAGKILLSTDMEREISVDKNSAAGLLAGASYVATSIILVAVSGVL